MWKFYLNCLTVVGGIIAQPSLRSKATVEKPNGHIGNEMPQVVEGTLNCRLICLRVLVKERKKVFDYGYLSTSLIFRLTLTLSAVENISQCSKE